VNNLLHHRRTPLPVRITTSQRSDAAERLVDFVNKMAGEGGVGRECRGKGAIEHEESLLSSLRGPGWIVFGQHLSPTRTFGDLRRKVELREVVDDRSCQTRHIAPHSGGVDGVVASDERCAFITDHRRLRVVAFLPGVPLPVCDRDSRTGAPDSPCRVTAVPARPDGEATAS
jgi:hypothetical protein